MCTVSWSPAPGGYRLFFNRDERRSRLPGLPPRLDAEAGVSFLAPRDADAGGTWVAVNEHGLTVGLLNLYQAAALPARPGRISRGLLVRSLAASSSLAAAARLLEGQDLEAYSPFTLVVAASAPSGEAEGGTPSQIGSPPSPSAERGAGGRGPDPLAVVTYAWDGKLAGKWRAATPPVVSSGYDVVGATARRTQLFASLGDPARLGWDRLLGFHRSHQPEKGAYSPCMHRADAKTVSLTAIVVEPQRVLLAYASGSPCVTELAPPLELART